MELKIKTENNSEEELLVKEVVEKLNKKYKLPILTDNIFIEQGIIPHSHPVLTLGVEKKEIFLVLKDFLHEQFHWFEAEHPEYNEAINFLKNKYKNLGDCDRGDKNTDSFWQHIIVCWNTRNFLQNNIGKSEVDEIYKNSQPYPLTEKFVGENFEEIKNDLLKFDMVWR